ncbi:hypothetical protein [Roseibium alexandrii]|uniref:Uncharacterized protein n=1 Tax=Roseibium alexandrii (strain DSM 17067 / NCIMB 14079 / DFL-11) TaxID=244592 RepID=A0A5E8UWV1_ROSAD|nr:hypothetical protein [Roseibium alexandrii]RMX61916.1 hypothetical protein SADFL11_00000790 [Roseibium alexandrii DFL-11]
MSDTSKPDPETATIEEVEAYLIDRLEEKLGRYRSDDFTLEDAQGVSGSNRAPVVIEVFETTISNRRKNESWRSALFYNAKDAFLKTGQLPYWEEMQCSTDDPVFASLESKFHNYRHRLEHFPNIDPNEKLSYQKICYAIICGEFRIASELIFSGTKAQRVKWLKNLLNLNKQKNTHRNQ